jgi:hypothetical protein
MLMKVETKKSGWLASSPGGKQNETNQTKRNIMAVDIPDLMKMTQAQLDDLFKQSPAGPIPDGEAQGTAIIAPGTELEGTAAKFIHFFAWQGKVFDAKAGELRNKILPMGFKAIIAKVYKDPSWYDGKECIALDYSQTSLLAHWIRDEIRMVGDGVYLGIVYWGKTKLIDFALKFPK